MALRMAFREDKVSEMADEMAEKVMEGMDDGSVLGKGSRVRLLTLPGQAWSQRVGEELK